MQIVVHDSWSVQRPEIAARDRQRLLRSPPCTLSRDYPAKQKVSVIFFNHSQGCQYETRARQYEEFNLESESFKQCNS